MRSLLFAVLLAEAGLAQQVPVTCLAGARFHVSDLGKARDFYTRVFGLQERSGTAPDSIAFQINSRQYLEFSSGDSGDAANPLELVVFGTSRRPAAPLKDPDGRGVEFVTGTRNFRPSPNALSNHLLHIGMGTTDMNRSIDFYGSRFGCKEIFRRPDFNVLIMKVPEAQEDWVEFIQRGEQGSDHICLDVPDIQRAYQALQERGAQMRGKPRIASNGYWVINMADPNGVRVELMEPRPAAK